MLVKVCFGPGCGISCYMFCEHLITIYTLLLLGGAFCKCHLDPVSWQCCWVLCTCRLSVQTLQLLKKEDSSLKWQMWIYLFLLSGLPVLASNILLFCCGIHTHLELLSFWKISICHCVLCYSVADNFLCFGVYFIRHKYTHCYFILISICMVYWFHLLNFRLAV